MANKKQEKYKWADIPKEVLHEENPYEFITPNALDAIKNLEYHKKPEDANFKGKITRTTRYGITQKGLDGLDNLRIKYRVEVPEIFIDADVNKLTEEQCRLAAAYRAMLNTKDIEEITNSKGFSKQSLGFRAGVMTAIHTRSMYNDYKQSYLDKSPGSFLLACESGNPYSILKSLLIDKDENLQQEFEYGKDRGLNKRNLVAVLSAMNPGLTWNDAEAKEWENAMTNGTFTKTLYNNLKENEAVYNAASVDADNLLYGNMYLYQNDARKETQNNMQEQMTQYANDLVNGSPKTAQNEDFWQKVGSSIAGAIKSVLGQNNETPNQVAEDEKNKYSDEEFSDYKGTINLNNRPRVKNEDGSISTIRSISYNEDGKEILIPTISNEGKLMGDEEAIQYWDNESKKLSAKLGRPVKFHLGMYDTVEEANEAADKIHRQQAGQIRRWSKKK